MLFKVEELADKKNSPPEIYVTQLDENTAAMRGTLEQRIRCIALSGNIGTEVQCSIYNNRPTCCRKFQASYENGERNKRCDKARMAKGLTPLSIDDWLTTN